MYTVPEPREPQVCKIESVHGMPLNMDCRMYQVDNVGKFLEERPGLVLVYYNAATRTLYVPQEQ